MGEPCPGARLPHQDRSSGRTALTRVGFAPGQGCSLGTAHTLTVPAPLTGVLDSHNLHLSAHITFNEPDRHYAVLFKRDRS